MKENPRGPDGGAEDPVPDVSENLYRVKSVFCRFYPGKTRHILFRPVSPGSSFCQPSFPMIRPEAERTVFRRNEKNFRPYKIFPLFIIWNGVLVDIFRNLRRQSGLADRAGQEKEENMPHHSAQQSVPGTRLLRLFILLLRDGRKHYLADLKRALGCSPQTVLRMTDSIAAVIGGNFTTGMDNKRRWYRLEKDGSLSGAGEVKGGQAVQEGIPRIAVSDILDIETGALSYAAHADHIRTFLHAAGEGRLCRFGIVPGETALLLPVRLFFRDGLLYFAGWRFSDPDDGHPEAAFLPVHLISSVTPAGRPESEIAASGRVLLPQFPTDESCPVRVYLGREYAGRVMQDLIPGYAVERCDDGGIILNMKEGSTPFRAWLKSFGEGARVLGGVRPGRAGLPGAAVVGRFGRKK